MPGKMKAPCSSCGNEIVYEKDSVGREVAEINDEEFENLCGDCSDQQRKSKNEAERPAEVLTN